MHCIVYRLLTDFRFSAEPTDRRALRYGGGRVGLVWNFVTGGQNWPKKRYIIVEWPLSNLVIVTLRQLSIHGNVSYLEINQMHELKHKYTCVHPRGWTDYCTSHEPKLRHWANEGFITPRLPCGTRSRWTCVIPDSRSTPLEQNWNLTFSPLIDCFFSVVHSCTLLL